MTMFLSIHLIAVFILMAVIILVLAFVAMNTIVFIVRGIAAIVCGIFDI